MSIKYEDECFGCPPNMGCLGSACPHRNVHHYYCDVCGADCDPDDLHEDLDGGMICDECLEERYPRISHE